MVLSKGKPTRTAPRLSFQEPQVTPAWLGSVLGGGRHRAVPALQWLPHRLIQGRPLVRAVEELLSKERPAGATVQ